MNRVRVLVVRAAGINCDEEIMHCWRAAGASPDLFHLDQLLAEPTTIRNYRIVTIPGGFSFGDDIGAGVIFAQRLRLSLSESFRELIDRGGGILGVCNGFQILVKAGLLPGGDSSGPQVTVTYNDSAKFEARWVRLRVCTDRCPFLTPGAELELPVEHAEGRVVTVGDNVLHFLQAEGQIALRYVDETGCSESYPANPNGSTGGIAGLCDPTGRILGLMPHPDRYFHCTHHPRWTSQSQSRHPDGLSIFENAVRYWSA